jgi:hypothetical protein
MLKDLQGSLSKHHVAVPLGNIDQTQGDKGVSTQRESSREIRNTDAACNIVSHIFRYIDICLSNDKSNDKSKMKLSLFSKSFIKGMLTGNVKNGIDDFIRNMNDQEVRSLLDDIQHELNKRK